MLKVQHAAQLQDHAGQLAGHGRWREITQDMVDRFADLTGDTHWIHTDPGRARAQGPFGGTIVHGFLTLSLLTSSLHDCFEVTAARRWVNYGLDRVRFTRPVRPGQRVRLALTIQGTEASRDGGTRIRCGCVLEIEGQEHPALRADLIVVAYEAEALT